MADEYTARQAHGERAIGEEFEVGIADFFAALAIHFVDAGAKLQIQHPPRLADRIVAELGQLMIAEQKMNLVGKLALPFCRLHEQLMGRIRRRVGQQLLMDELVQDYMPR